MLGFEMDSFRKINTIIERDSKDTTYKFALLRAVIDILQEYPHLKKEKNRKVVLPMGLLVEKWLFYYYPLIEGPEFLPQMNGESPESDKQIAFRTDLKRITEYYKDRGGFSAFNNDYQNSTIPKEIMKDLLTLIKNLKRIIIDMPMRYIGRSISRDEYSIFTFDDTRSQSHGAVSVNTEFLINSLGTFSFSEEFYEVFLSLRGFNSGEDSLVYKWAKFTVGADKTGALTMEYVLKKLQTLPARAHLRTDILELDILEISENQEMQCPLDCSEIDEPFECGRRFKRWLMRQPIRQELVYTIVLLKAKNVSTDFFTPSISILPEKTHVFDSSGNSYYGCGYMCRTLAQTLEEKYKTTLSEIEIPPGSTKRLILLYPEIALGKRIIRLKIDTYVFTGWSRSFLESCTLSFAYKEGREERIIKEKSVEAAVSDSDNYSTPEPKGGLDEQCPKQDLDRFPVATCENCGMRLFEVGRRFCSVNCLTTYTRRERVERRSPREPESSLDSEHSEQGPVRFRDASGNQKWGTVEETAEALLPRLREWAQDREINEIKWKWAISDFLNTQEIAFRYHQTRARERGATRTKLINALFRETLVKLPTEKSNQQPASVADESDSALDGNGRRCPECGGRRLIRQGSPNELLCMDCYFVVAYM